MTTVDVLAIAPHPDDAELYCAGTLLVLQQRGYRIGIADMTRGELSTRGTLEQRARETTEATRILGLDLRVNLGLPDGGIANIPEQRHALIRLIRSARPRVLLLPYTRDRHPDHAHTAEVARDAAFLSGLVKIESTDEDGKPQHAWRPPALYHYMLTQDFEPAFIIDISEVFDRKLEAIRAYGTQFHTGTAMDGPSTYISSPEFLDALIGRSRRLGFLAGGTHGEGFATVQPLRLEAEWLLGDDMNRG